jgi:UDP-glucose 4-epimerase
MRVLITGGAGYIGSHTVLELLDKGFKVTVIDNLCNSNQESLNRVEKLTDKKINFYKIDLRDKTSLEGVFKQDKFDAVIHFAALKSIDKSVTEPLEYYDNNVIGTLNLLEVMQKHNVKTLLSMEARMLSQ